MFREHFVRGFERLLKDGKLKLKGEFRYLRAAAGRDKLLQELRAVTWVAYIEPPPTSECRAETVLKYLARYLTGGPISNARIVSADEHEVTFLAREGKVPGGEAKQVPITITTTEFVRLWSLGQVPDESLDIEPLIETATEGDIPAAQCCPGCGRPMILQGERRKRSWSEVMTSASRPSWYRHH